MSQLKKMMSQSLEEPDKRKRIGMQSFNRYDHKSTQETSELTQGLTHKIT